MSEDIQVQLDRVVKKKLDEVSDKLNIEIDRFEDGLKQISLGVRVFIPLGNSPMKLGYEKWNDDKWHVVLVYKNSAGDEIINPLSQAPRNVRLFGYRHRMELIPAMIKAAEALTKRIEKALAGEIEEDGNQTEAHTQV